jgi:4-amino-4-deoxy-L-arabinose transferase-like glycosyltransferase
MARETALALPEADDVKPASGLAPVDRRIFIVAGAAFALLMAFSARYGFDSDELYFLDCARHLSWSYVDQPALVPLMARISLDLFGVSVVGLRLWPALAAFATVIVSALLAREFGGGRKAQLTCAIGVATAPGLLVPDHILDTAPLDLLAWSALALLVVRMGRTGNTRLWVPAGVILGVGLNNKNLIGFFAIAIVIGTLLSGGIRFLANRFFALGALIAVAFVIPGMWWQARHGWAVIAFTKSLNAEVGGIHYAATFVFWQLFMVAPVLIVVWFSGLRSLWRSSRPLWRALAWSYGLLGLFFAVTSGDRTYYLAATYFYLLAAGAVVFERRWAAAPSRTRALFGLAVPLYTLLNLVIILPVLPARLAGWTAAVDTEGVQSIGWPELTATVAQVWHRLPAAQQADAVIFTANYGEAGAINELGARYHLPRAVSGHNTLWWWGPGNPGATTVVAVVNDKAGSSTTQLTAQLRRDFASVRAVATISNDGNPYENGGHVYLCTGPVRSWGSLWPSLRDYG